MWPIRNDLKDRIEFKDSFWDQKDRIFYFNADLFDDSKKIKAIYGGYAGPVRFNPDEIAMGVHYEKSDLGRHTLLFSYLEDADIEYPTGIALFLEIFNDYITSDIEDALLYRNLKRFEKGKISSYEMYLNYLEGHLTQFSIQNDFDHSIIKEWLTPFIESDDMYLSFLEQLNNKLLSIKDSWIYHDNIFKAINSNNPEYFYSLILDILKNDNIGNIRKIYDKKLNEVKELGLYFNIDLDDNFKRTRDILIKQVELQRDPYNSLYTEAMFEHGEIVNMHGKAIFKKLEKKNRWNTKK